MTIRDEINLINESVAVVDLEGKAFKLLRRLLASKYQAKCTISGEHADEPMRLEATWQNKFEYQSEANIHAATLWDAVCQLAREMENT